MAVTKKIIDKHAQKWGNSIGIRIPKEITNELHIEAGTEISMIIEGGKLVIEPKQKKDLSIEEMVDLITEENKHGLIDFGEPVGREIF